jgi:type IV pilus assembly protein PilY1
LPTTAGRTNVRVGLSTYRTFDEGANGGVLRVAVADFNATLKTTLQTSINSMSAVTYTPLASTLADIGRYLSSGYAGPVTFQRPQDASVQSVAIDTLFKLNGTDNPTRNACLLGAPNCATTLVKPIQEWCQRSSIFAVTDGRPNLDRAFNSNSWMRDFDGDCANTLASTCVGEGASSSWDKKKNRNYEDYGSDYMDDVAEALFRIDLRPDIPKPPPTASRPLAKNNVVTYMIGFADPAVQSDPLLMKTAERGGGRFIAASDGPGLDRAFDQVISDAIALDAAAAAVAVTNAQITSGTVGYASSYVSGSWYGDLEAYSLELTTGLQNGGAQWSARDKLNAFVVANGHAARKIATYDGSRGRAFTVGSASDFRGTTTSMTDDVINYTRGLRTMEPAVLRARNYLLGDIINAEPVVVNYSSGAVVFQASNDGMLHAFDGTIGATTSGQELWAYVPRLVHGKLAGRAAVSGFEHEYLVDGTPAVAQIGSSRVLVGGLGKGGAGYYALNITSGTAADEAAVVSKVLWEFTNADMGYSFGTPLIVKTAAGWRVVVASGYGNQGTGSGGLGGDGRGRVWLLDPDDGSIKKTFKTPVGFGTTTDPLGLAYLAKPQNHAADDVVRFVYGGDLKGNVWRIDLDDSNNSDLLRIAAVNDGTSPVKAQPITTAPVVAPVAGSGTKFLVYFGTGQYFSIDDVPGTASPNTWAGQRQTIYGIVDDTSQSSPALPNIRGTNGTSCPTGTGAGGNGDLVCQAATGTTVTHHPVDLNTKRGFYVDLPTTPAGGRVNTQGALTSGGTLVMIVNVPTNAKCDPGGSSYLFQLSGSTGGAIVKTYGGSDYFQSVFLIGNALSSRPVIVTTSTGPRALLRMSDKETESLSIDQTAGSAPAFRRIYMRPLN